MKKILFPLFAMLLFVSCSSDDDNVPYIIPNPGPENTMKATIGGIEYTFDSFTVETITVVEPDYTYVDLHIFAKINGDNTKTIEFNMEQMQTGTETIYYFYHLNGDIEYTNDANPNAFNTNVLTSTAHNISGTFSGPLANFDDSETVTITNGSFNINY